MGMNQRPDGSESRNALVLFTKAPRPGLVKTRLIAQSGSPYPTEIASLYTSLLEDTLSAIADLVKSVESTVIVSFMPDDAEGELRELVAKHSLDARFQPQRGQTVTQKVKNAISAAFKEGFDSVALIPGDHADLSGLILGSAFEMLSAIGPAVVLGPTSDGGAYLLGFNRESFGSIDFNLEDTHLVCADVFRRARVQGIPCHFLDNRNDIDDWEDARRFLAQQEMSHTRTWKAVQRLGAANGPVARRAEVSVIVPTLNEEAYLGGLLDSLNSQTSPDFEVIVVDGASRDGTVDRAWGRADSIVFVAAPSRRNQENVAASDARGDALLFLHADMAVPPTLIETVARTLRDGAVFGGSCRVMFRGRTSGVAFLNAVRLCGSRLFGIHGISAAFFVRRRVFERVGGFRPDVMEEAVDLQRRVSSGRGFVTLPVVCTTSARRFAPWGKFVPTLVVWIATVLLTASNIHFTSIERQLWKSVT